MLKSNEPVAQANKVAEIRKELSELIRTMDNYSAFDEEVVNLNGIKKRLYIIELGMKRKIREYFRRG